MSDQSFSACLKQYRVDADLTQHELAEQIGCSRSTIDKLERGKLRPSKYLAERIAGVLKLAADERTTFLRVARQKLPAPACPPPDPEANELRPLADPLLAPGLIGRTGEVTAACALLRQPHIRLLTLCGPPGVGKTRLGSEIAAQLSGDFHDGVRLIILSSIRDPELLISTLAHAIGMQERGDRSLFKSLLMHLSDKQMLLVLDNFEHLVSVAQLVTDLIMGAPQLKILVTSRVMLRVSGEHIFSVPPLGLPQLHPLPSLDLLVEVPAVLLFVERARAQQPDFTFTTENAAAIVEICVHLDGLPLAIELAAARSRLFAPVALLARLTRRLELLRRIQRAMPTHHQSLRASLDWSYHLLTDTEQLVLCCLGVFVGGCTVEAVETIVRLSIDTHISVLDGLEMLLDHHLLQQEQATGSEPRFRMLETIREYALDQLTERGISSAIQHQHAAYYASLAETAEPEIIGPNPLIWSTRLEQELDNLRAALRWMLDQGDVVKAGHFAFALWRFWYRRGYLSEGQQWLTMTLNAIGGEAPALRARLLNSAGIIAWARGDYVSAIAFHEEGLCLCQALGDKLGAARALGNWGNVAVSQSDYARALPLQEASLELFRAVEDHAGIANTLSNLAEILAYQGQYEQAARYFEESLALRRTLGDRWSIALGLSNLGCLMLDQGDLLRAQTFSEESLGVAQENGYGWISAISLTSLGQIAFYQGAYTQAAALHEQGLMLQRDIDDRSGIAVSLLCKGRVALGQGDVLSALRFCHDSLLLIQALGETNRTLECIEELAAVATALGQPDRAAHLWGAAEALRAARSIPMPLVGRDRYTHTVMSACTECQDAVWATEWAAGRTLTLDQAINAALSLSLRVAMDQAVPLYDIV